MTYIPKKKAGLLIPKAKGGVVAATSGSSAPPTPSPLLADPTAWTKGAESYGRPAAERVARNWGAGKMYSRYSAYAQPLDSALQANYPRFSEAKRAIDAVNPDDIQGRNRVVDSLKKAGHTYALTPEQEKQSLAQFGPEAWEEFQATRREALANRPSNVLGTNESNVDVSRSRWGIGNSAASAPPVAKYSDRYDDQAGNVYPRSEYTTRINYSPKAKTYSYETKADTVYPVPAARPARFSGMIAGRKQGGLLNGKKL